MNPSWHGDEVDAVERAAAVVLVEVGGAGDPGRELGEGGRLAAPEVAHGVAVLAVPLRPQRREVAHLVAAGADVPRFGDQLHLADHRVLLHHLEEGGEPVHLVELAGQGGGQVEAEAVDVHLGHPVPQRIHDQLQRVRAAHVEAVAGAGVVDEVAAVLLAEPVVARGVHALEAQRRPEVVALGGVVVDHVEDDLDAGRVQRLDHAPELLHLLAEPAQRGVAVVRGEEADGVVTPVVAQPQVDEAVVVHELVHRHQLDRGHPEPGQVVDHRRGGDARVRAAQLLRDVRVAHGQPAHVRLVDHRVVVRGARRLVVAPVEVRVDHHRLRHERRRVGLRHPLRLRHVVVVDRRVPLRRHRRWPWRTGRAAACAGCSAARSPGRTGRAPGSRSAGPARCPAGTRATRRRPPRAARRGAPRRCPTRRRGTARSARPPRRRWRSWCPSRRRWRPGDTARPARPACRSLDHGYVRTGRDRPRARR